jgi:hypothetical protein
MSAMCASLTFRTSVFSSENFYFKSPSSIIENEKAVENFNRINEFWLKLFSHKFESKALIHSQSDTFRLLDITF